MRAHPRCPSPRRAGVRAHPEPLSRAATGREAATASLLRRAPSGRAAAPAPPPRARARGPSPIHRKPKNSIPLSAAHSLTPSAGPRASHVRACARSPRPRPSCFRATGAPALPLLAPPRPCLPSRNRRLGQRPGPKSLEQRMPRPHGTHSPRSTPPVCTASSQHRPHRRRGRGRDGRRAATLRGARAPPPGARPL